jgi:erythronate-4-phosphate dehydrogenase
VIKIIIDNKIPFIRGVLEPFAEIFYIEGNKICNSDVREADGLIIRTRTLCNESLLKNSNVRFIVTATIGYDHIDTDYCRRNNIAWTNAPGSNAQSVAQYVTSALLQLSLKKNFSLTEKKIGIIGVGNVGSKVAESSIILGMKVLLNDPPREEKEGKHNFCSLQQICEEADIITLHVPLIHEGKHKTYHFLDHTFFSRLKKKPILINTARGEIISSQILKKALYNHYIDDLVLDCWENEPFIDRELLRETSIGTPHIAGYSLDGKANATMMSVRSVSKFFGFPLDHWQVSHLPEPSEPEMFISDPEKDLAKAVLHTYNIMQDDFHLKKNPASFEELRGNYPLRREYNAYTLHGPYSETLVKLGFRYNQSPSQE